MTNTTLNIQGMTCGGCVNSVSTALQRETGVINVEVLLDQAMAKIEYDPALTNPQRLATAVEEIGFEVQ